MGLLKCFECGNEVSEFAENCPKCGCPVEIIKRNTLSKNRLDKSGICIYQGVEYNLSEIEDLLNSNKFMEATKVVCEKLGLDPLKASFFVKVIQFNDNKIPLDYDKAIVNYREHNKAEVELNAVHCKYCGSTNVKKLGYWSGGWRATYGGLQWHCNNCDSDF